MRFLESSVFRNNKKNTNEKQVDTTDSRKPSSLTKFIIWLVRIVLGSVFIFSGFAKGVDPWGGLYKVADYFAAWDIDATHELLLVCACALALFEFLLGVTLLTGIFKRFGAWLALIFMSFMTALTLYIWIADPVADCGCFGDALVLSNSMTFLKNIVLLILCVVLVRYGQNVYGLFLPSFQWLVLVASALYLMAIQLVGYTGQPLIDFRPYPVGTDMVELVEANLENESQNQLFVYEKEGKKQDFTADNLPDDTWTFVERIDNNDNDNSSIAIFDGEDDITEDVFKPEGDQYIIAVSDPERYGISRSEMANRLFDYAQKNGDDMFCIIATDPDSVANWKQKTEARYPVYTAEDTDLKMLVRGDAGFVMLRDGKIFYKTNVFALAPYFPLGKQTIQSLEEAKENNVLAKFTIIWLIAILILYGMSRLFYVFGWFKSKNEAAPKKEENDKSATSDDKKSVTSDDSNETEKGVDKSSEN